MYHFLKGELMINQAQSARSVIILPLLLFISLTTLAQASEKRLFNPSGNISIKQVTKIVRTQNLAVKAALKNIQAKNQLVKQAGVLPNPEFELESENIFGSGEGAGFDNAETTAKLSTILELGGKRHFRKMASKLEQKVSKLEYESVLSNVINQANQLGTEVLRQQSLLELDKERLKSNQAFLSEIKTRVEKGRLNVVEQKRANILVSQSGLSIKKRRMELTNARNQLSLTWGFPNAQFDSLHGDIQEIEGLPSLILLEDRLGKYVGLRIKRAEVELTKVSIEIEKSLGSQDLTLAGGIKHENSSDDKSFIVSAGLPLAIFDRNTDAIKASKFVLREKEIELADLSIKSEHKLNTLYNQITLLGVEIAGLKNEIIPQSQEVFNTLKNGYLKGKFSYLEVLESQNTLFEFRESYTDTLAQYHNLYSEIRLLTGDLTKGEKNESGNN